MEPHTSPSYMMGGPPYKLCIEPFRKLNFTIEKRITTEREKKKMKEEFA
jgi:hypothetical protein